MRIFIFILIYVVALFSQDFSLNFDGDDDYVVINNSFLDSDEDPITFVFKISLNNIENEELFGGSLFGQFTNSWCGYNNFVKINHSALTFDHYGPSGGGIDISHNFYSSLKKEYTLYLTKDSDSLHLYVNNGIFISYYGSAYHPENYNESFSTTPVIGSRRCEWVDEWRDEFSGKIDELIIIQKTYTLDQIINQQYLMDENHYLAFYDFNSGQGNILYDISGNDNHGTIYGATWIENTYGCTDELAANYDLNANWDDSSCQYPENGNFSLSFDGNNDYVESNLPNFNLIEDFSVYFVFKTDSEYYGRIINKDCNNCSDGEWKVDIQGDGRILFEIEPGGGNPTASLYSVSLLNDNTFHEIIVTRNNTTGQLKIFVDGILEDSVLSQNNIYSITNDYPLQIGAIYSSENISHPFKGFIKNIKIWNTNLNDNEINDIFLENVTNHENIVTHFNFSSGSGNILYDHSGNQNHGLISGASWEQQPILGCTDPLAENFNINATIDDESCNGSQVNYQDFTYFGELNGNYYYLSNYNTDWNNAFDICSNSGGHLVTITSEEENNFVSSMNDVWIWLGATDLNQEGNWEWITGEPFTYTNWYQNGMWPNQPSGDNSENYIGLNFNANAGDFSGLTKWADEPSHFEFRFVLEIECSDGYYDCLGNCLNDQDGDLICDEQDDCIGEYDQCGECNGNGYDQCDDDNNGMINLEEWGYGAHSIIVEDVPNDLGGRVYINFSKSFYDNDTLSRNTEDYTIERLDDGVWVGVAFQGAYGIDQYTVEVQTLVDNIETEFRVIANMYEGNFASLINGFGVSIENSVTINCTDQLAIDVDEDGNCIYPSNGNYSLSFDGVDDYVSLDPPFEGYNNNYSIALSFYANSYDGRMIYHNRNHDMGSYIRLTNNPANNNIELNFYVGTDAQNCPGYTTNSGYCAVDLYYPVALDQWYDVVGTYNGQIMKLYVDGNLVNSVQLIGNQYWSGPSLDGQQGYWYTRIGDNNGGGYIPIDGKIDNIVIFDTALSENQIMNLKTNLLNGNEQNIRSLYKFNASNGNILYDYSSNQNHGIIYGANWIENIYGCTDELAENYDSENYFDDGSCVYSDNGDFSLRFDGIDDYVNLGSYNSYGLNSLSQSFSLNFNLQVSVFTNVPDYIIGTPMYDANNNRGFRINANTNNISVHVGGNSSTVEVVSDEIQINTWYNVTAIFNRENDILKLMINGVEIGSTSLSSIGTINNIHDINIGAFNASSIGYVTSDQFFHGLVDDLSIWNTSLNEDDVLLVMQNNYNSQSGLIAHWKFNAGLGEILYDHSGNQNHGTIFGASWTDNSVNQCCFESYGDVNCDTIFDISDIIIIIDMILDLINLTYDQNDCADINADGIIDISDLILLIDSILGF